jgi:hypothetical protein
MTAASKRFRIRLGDPNPVMIPATVLVTGVGVALLAWVGWLVWYDTTTWQKSLGLILLGPRLGEAMSLGIGVTGIHYLLVGVVLVPVGVVGLMMASVKGIRIAEGDHELRYTEASASSPSHLTARITMTVSNHGVLPVTLRDTDVTLVIGGVTASSLFFKEEGFTILPRGEREFVIGCRIMGEEADALYAAPEYETNILLRGDASTAVYKTPFIHEVVGMRQMVHAEA